MRKILIPRMCDLARGMAAAFRHFGIPAETLPPTTPESFAIGSSLCWGSECSPCFATTGDLFAYLSNHPENAPGNLAYFMPDAIGPCRFGQYNRLIRHLLNREGYEDLEVFAPGARASYIEARDYGLPLQLLIWKAVAFGEMIHRCLLAIRPFEARPGETDRVYEKSMARLEEVIETGNDRLCLAAAEEVAEEFSGIPTDRDLPRPLIAVVGEVYVRLNEFNNNQIIRIIESYGGQAELEPFSIWIYYANVTTREQSVLKRDLRTLGKIGLRHWVQSRIAGKYERIFGRLLPQNHETPVSRILEYSRRYLHHEIKGEAPLTIGAIVDRARKGCHGIVNMMPLNCMPANTVKAMIPELSKDLGGIPIVTLEVKDGSQGPHLRTRIGPFVEAARSFMISSR